PTATAEPTASPTAPAIVYGPDSFPVGVNPLTGLEVDDPTILDRRPVMVKVQNIPRYDRPQFGLSLADIVYEYYTEEGATRFAAIYYGQDAEVVAPIRSARFIDMQLVQMYDSVFVFGSAYSVLRNRLFSADFANRLIIEGNNWLPAVQRYDPNKRNYLSVNTAALQSVLTKNGVDNQRQDLAGMYFSSDVPQGGEEVEQFVVRYSSAIYNRWDYDPATGRYLRFEDTENDTTGGKNEVFAQLTDALNDEPVTADTVVMVVVQHEIRDPSAGTEVVDMQLLGRGEAYVARDGKIYTAQWQRQQPGDVLSLVDANGDPFPFKPGQTWFEIMSASTTVDDSTDTWRFVFGRDW
ncbi:MAG TPA: DUF3048 domain-containing protein, partial [Anaerolineaceae bacterium]|nr:DUF3048 domain-containing protein [Anaerolineaceae bacterium]